MSREKQANLYEARKPLRHGRLLEEKLLFYHENAGSVFKYRGPYIVFAGHPSLIGGEAQTFFNEWRDESKNLLVLTGRMEETNEYGTTFTILSSSRRGDEHTGFNARSYCKREDAGLSLPDGHTPASGANGIAGGHRPSRGAATSRNINT